MIDAGVDINWLDIIKPENRIGGADHPWENNEDDGWYHVDLPFDFNWFGKIERRITVGTNGTPLNFTPASQFCPFKSLPSGAITFGDAQLPYGDSEPLPCQWAEGAGQGAGQSGCVQNGEDGATAATGGHYGVEIDGIIAPFWCDLNPGDTTEESGTGVYFEIITNDNERLLSWQKIVIEYNVPIFGGASLYNFEAILSGDGYVLLQYKDMPAETGSWSGESIGFEDQTGTIGV